MRKAFNFFRSYYDVAMELNDKDRLAFYDALLNKQFNNCEPTLNGMSKFAYLSQKHSIDAQVKGYFDKTKNPLFDPSYNPCQGGSVGASVDPSVQGKEEGEEEEEVKEIYSFDEFWSTYDKSIGKKNCKAKFEKLSDEVKLKIKEVLPLYVQSTHDKQFRKHPITWLNQECWNDDVKTIMKEETVEEMNDRMLYENVMKKINMYHAKD